VRKGSAPELFTRPDASDAVQSPAPPAQRSASTSATPVLRPMAIPALKGLSFLTGRSRSNPGTPRDSKPLSVRPTVPEAGDKKQKRSVSADVYSDEKPPEVLIAPFVDVPTTPAPAYLPLPVPASPIPSSGPIDDAARMRQGASATSRSTSPGPSLSEALFRARRPATPHTPGKGTRFKSSFTGVADHVLRLGEQHQQQQVQAQTSGDLKGANNNGGPSSEATETPGGE
jgi:metal transporter CNNM